MLCRLFTGCSVTGYSKTCKCLRGPRTTPNIMPFVCIYMYIYIYICVCVCVCVFVCVCVCVCVLTSIGFTPGGSSTVHIYFFFFFHWCYNPLWALACRTRPLHLSLSITNSLNLLTPNTLRSLPSSSLHSFPGLLLGLVPSSSWVKIFLGILSSSILSRWPN